MCGFFGISDKSLINWSNVDFEDVTERGEYKFPFMDTNTFMYQSVLPVTGSFSGPQVFDNDHFRFTFTGEIYSAPINGYANDTEWLAEKIAREDYDFDNVNGQYAISVYDKKKQTITLIRDPIGQVPLFYYNYNNCLIYSNTIKSIAKVVGAKIDKSFLKNWHQLRHYTLTHTHYKRIKLFPKGLVITYNMRGKALKSRVISPKRTYNGNIRKLLKDVENSYSSHRMSCGIVSGGVDSSVVSALYRDSLDCYITTINEDKCWASSDAKNYGFPSLIEVKNNEKEWCEAAVEYINKSWMIPYTWSYVGYYIMGVQVKSMVKVMITGEGADEIFGGYDVYNTNKLSKYSLRKDGDILNDKYKQQVAKQVFLFNNVAQANKYLDQRSFLPCAAIGANLALGMSCIESRNPFLDHSIFYNDAFVEDIGKQRLVKIFKDIFNFDPPKKQGFSGYMNELYNYINNTKIANDPKDIGLWKDACYQIMETV
jgi:asparagine synthase (glutamine-hydrolysing)